MEKIDVLQKTGGAFNRTILELKYGLVFESTCIGGLQSHHTGIEIGITDNQLAEAISLQSHHTGIEIEKEES